MNELRDLAPYLFQFIALVIFFTKMDSRLKAIEEQVKEMRQEMKANAEKIITLEKQILENKIKHDYLDTFIHAIKTKIGLEI